MKSVISRMAKTARFPSMQVLTINSLFCIEVCRSVIRDWIVIGGKSANRLRSASYIVYRLNNVLIKGMLSDHSLDPHTSNSV